ncbi:uncharacterized protein N7479_001652 [Penicillium vulpinum]|uniref:Uncharacterized protein n=1 Tax=Penicillium vulpinum TaxID=29845 RepID=A0A1V6QZK0_9EURO|nr:uncharacterized protein N7479_001652 [Penicillium vulpinum]KAJ5971734.1 hypothetical protein N7479_001652 [Penicillium vulpinum]OQD94630.1 hypothetical protein PENVUL_c134G02026 [Penicillium vulpinum]
MSNNRRGHNEGGTVPWADNPLRDPGTALSFPVSHLRFCLTCVKTCIVMWTQRGYENGFLSPFKVTCIQDSGSNNDCRDCAGSGVACVQIPEGAEGHRFELLALLSWVSLFWSPYDHLRASSAGLHVPVGVSVAALHNLGETVGRLCIAFCQLIENHIVSHSLQHNCPSRISSLRSYRTVLMNRELVPNPMGSTVPGNEIERLAVMSFSRHKLRDTEDMVHFWYGAVRDFQLTVTDTVQNDTRYTEHWSVQSRYISQFPLSILPPDLQRVPSRR